MGVPDAEADTGTEADLEAEVDREVLLVAVPGSSEEPGGASPKTTTLTHVLDFGQMGPTWDDETGWSLSLGGVNCFLRGERCGLRA